MRTIRPLLLACVAWLVSVPAQAQTGDNLLLVVNALSAASEEVAQYYARARGVPGANTLRLPLPIADEVSRADYDSKIERPIADWLMVNAAQDRILYIVLTKDVPLRVAGTGGQNGTVSSVDSELTLLYRKLTGVNAPPAGPVRNPYFLGDTPTPATTRFTHKTLDIYLVGRLDGYTVADVKRMIDRAASPSREGVVVLDGRFEVTQSVGNRWLVAASTALKRIYGWSDRVVLDTGQKVITDQPNVIGFYTWGSNAVAATERRFGHTFAPGAIAGEYVSTDARTFKEPPADWVVNDTKAIFGGSHQSLIGDLIRDGITGVAGHVAEPYLNATIRPDALFPAYVSGFNLIESFYMAMPSLGWQTVVIGDPLCAPFGPRPFPSADVSPAIDPETQMPQFFSARRLATIAATGAKPDVAKLVARAELEDAKKNPAAVREAFERASALDPDYAPVNLLLGSIYEQAREWDAAIARYQRVVDKSPNNVAALNNLAYLLATRKSNTADAFPLASKAYAVSVQDPTVGDTLAWIYHLMGNDAAGAPIITLSARRRPDHPEIQLHAALILAGANDAAAAARFLETALRLKPELADLEEVKALQGRLRTR